MKILPVNLVLTLMFYNDDYACMCVYFIVCESLPIPDCATPVYDHIHGIATFECQSGCVPMGINAPLRCNQQTRQFEGSSSFLCVSGILFSTYFGIRFYSMHLHNFAAVTFDENSTCPILESPRNSYRAYIYGTPGEIGSVIQFSCYRGSRLVGEQILTCQEDSTWDFAVPTCISKLK